MAMYPCLSLPSLSFPSVSGAVCSFDSQYAGLPLKSHTVDIDSVSGVSAINIGSDAKYAGFINFNQLIRNSYTTTTAWGATTSYDTTTHEFSITNDSRTTYFNTGTTYSGVSNISPVAGHKYYIRVTSDKDITGVTVGNISGVALTNNSEDVLVLPASWNTQYGFCLRITNRYDFVNAHPIGDVTKCKIVLMDLTEMFGAGNEPSTVDEVRALFPNDYYDYNAGTLTTVSAVNGSTNSFFTIPIGQTVNEATYNARTGVLEVTQPSVQTLQLPPCPIDTLQGVNNIWADTGDTTLQYIKLG